MASRIIVLRRENLIREREQVLEDRGRWAVLMHKYGPDPERAFEERLAEIRFLLGED